MKLKQWISVAVGCVFALSGAAACGPGEETPKISVPDAVFSDLWTEGAEKEFALGETYTLEINEEIGANNYILLDYESACGLDSTFYFAEQGNPENGFEERFYLAPEDSEFRQIIDYYGEYLYDKTLSRIEFRCVGNTGGAFRLNKMEIAEHAVDFSLVDFQDPSALEENMQLFLQGSYVKLGITLKSGGAINWLSSVNENISFSADLQNNGYVGDRARETVYLQDDVNLINAHDTGRLVQQSFYGTRGDSIAEPKDDYICGYFDHDGNSATPAVQWPYNPVQGGDRYENFSRLIDVQSTENTIYIKSRPMDWAKNGSLTPFYMENTYRLLEDSVHGEYIEVDNRMIDFSGYVHDHKRDQELPAFYGITPLGRLATYRGDRPWMEESYETIDNLGFWANAGKDNRFRATENWIAWLNEDDWGVGLYVPDVETMLVGRNAYSVDIGDIGVIPAQAGACTYTAPLGVFTMPNYEPFGYTYYLKLGYVNFTRDFFAQLHAAGASNDNIVELEKRA